jgi:drug/metabolite transporter (DMT)-like permease
MKIRQKGRQMTNKKEIFMQKTVVVWFGALVCCVLWGSAFPCIKLGYEMFQIPSDAVGSQILFAGYRFTLAGILAIIIGSILSRKVLIPKKDSWGKIFQLSLLQTVAQYLLFYIGLAHTAGVKASIIEGVNVFIAIMVASLIFKQEKLTAAKIFGSVIGFVGVLFVSITKNGFDMNMSFMGEGFIFLSAASSAFSSVYLKRFSNDDNPVVLSGYQFLIGGIIISTVGFLAGGKVSGFTATHSMMLLYLAIISAVAYSLWGILLKYNPVSRVAIFGFMNPVFGVILSALLLNEKEQAFKWNSMIALILVCVGIYIVNKVKEEVQINRISTEK